jgi:hypothetical protein
MMAPARCSVRWSGAGHHTDDATWFGGGSGLTYILWRHHCAAGALNQTACTNWGAHCRTGVEAARLKAGDLGCGDFASPASLSMAGGVGLMVQRQITFFNCLWATEPARARGQART